MTNIKKIILRNNILLKLFGIITQLFFKLFKCKINGKLNILQIAPTSILRNVRIKINGNSNFIELSEKSRLKNVFIEINGSHNKIIISKGVIFYEGGYILFEENNSTISIGKNTTIGSAYLSCGEEKTKIIIGEDCMFSRNITVSTSDFHSIIDLEDGKRINLPEDVMIGNHNWIGNGVNIGKGTKFNDNNIIATRALLSRKKFDSNCIIGGIPAKIIKSNVSWSREKITF